MNLFGIVYIYTTHLALLLLAPAASDAQSLRGEAYSAAAENLEQSQRQPQQRQLAADAYIFQSVADGYATGQGDKVGADCSTDARRVTFVEGGSDSDGEDYIDIVTSKWHSGGYRMDCKDKGSHTNWACWATCAPFPNPNFMDWTYLTFEVKVVNMASLAAGCHPRVKVQKRWPSLPSNDITMNGSYVDGGVLVDDEFRRVVIPIADLATADWPTVNGVKDLYFLKCDSGNVNPHYQVRGILLTDEAPAIGGAPETAAPTQLPSSSPTTGAPSAAPSALPTAAPTIPHWPIFESIEDEYAVGDPTMTCFIQKDRLGITTTQDAVEGDYFTMKPDPWVSGGIQFGCREKDANWQCIKWCHGVDPDWSDKLYLTFMAKLEGDLNPGCQPKVTLSGGGWPREASYALALQDTYVDQGWLVADEWRRVVIPLQDFKTDLWNLNHMYGMHFQTCGTEHGGNQPIYHIKELAVTELEFELISHPPSQSPTEYATDDPLLATHRWVHTNWYPILGADREPSGNTWITAHNHAWPMAPADAPPQSVTVLIPSDQTVVYSGADAIAYDKIIVEGSLTIRPLEADVSLTVGTIVVEEGGVLLIETDEESSLGIDIQIEGALDHDVDPEEQLLGIVSLEGNLTIAGNPVPTKMVALGEDTVPGSNILVVDAAVANDFVVGGELILPDTQTGLPVGHWNFLNLGVYVDQTESCIIASLQGNTITCESPLAFEHSVGSFLGYITRSITIRTSSESSANGHILHTGRGKFDVSHTRIQGLGRTTTDVIDSTVMAPVEGVKFPRDETWEQMAVTKLGNNQIARYALHAHHSLVESYFEGNALLYSPRDGCVAHNSRVHIVDNVIVGADGTGIFLEDATETGPVLRNYIIGTGGGTRGGDDGRFSSGNGLDMAHGGFGIWARGKLALIQDNHCEGHFGVAPYAFFVHPNFLETKVVPDVPGTPPELAGKLLKSVPTGLDNGLQLQTYGGFVNNSAVGTFQTGIDLSYFSAHHEDTEGSILEGATIRSLASSGRGISTTHSRIFTLDHVTLEGTVGVDNTITGIWCNNCNGCTLETPNTTLVVEHVDVVRGGPC